MEGTYAFETAFGWCRLMWRGEQVYGFALPELADTRAAHFGEDIPPEWVQRLAERVQRHLTGTAQDFSDVPFFWQRISGFVRDVLQAALHIKAGSVYTYGQLAQAMGLPSNRARAVGMALGRNPWPLLVPCHRVVGAGGKLTGFSAPGGVATKARLLALEGVELLAA